MELWSRSSGDDEALVKMELWSQRSGDDKALVTMELWSQRSGDDEALVIMVLEVKPQVLWLLRVSGGGCGAMTALGKQCSDEG